MYVCAHARKDSCQTNMEGLSELGSGMRIGVKECDEFSALHIFADGPSSRANWGESALGRKRKICACLSYPTKTPHQYTSFPKLAVIAAVEAVSGRSLIGNKLGIRFSSSFLHLLRLFVFTVSSTHSFLSSFEQTIVNFLSRLQLIF